MWINDQVHCENNSVFSIKPHNNQVCGPWARGTRLKSRSCKYIRSASQIYLFCNCFTGRHLFCVLLIDSSVLPAKALEGLKAINVWTEMHIFTNGNPFFPPLDLKTSPPLSPNKDATMDKKCQQIQVGKLINHAALILFRKITHSQQKGFP